MSRSISNKIYEVIVSLYPKRHREQYGEEMRYVFSEQLREADSLFAASRLWVKTVSDSTRSLIREHNEAQGEKSMNKSTSTNKLHSYQPFVWLAVLTIGILLVPLMAMQLQVSGVMWELFDFLVMGILIYGIGTVFIVGARMIHGPIYRLGFAVLCVVLLLYVWAELAVGIFTDLGS